MKQEIIIDQTVHGYSDGHRLLAASCQLSPGSQRILLELSDLSGDIIKGFDEYLTGYPLPETNYYALAKTWYASEMERPGCVWTHTLLIKRDDFHKTIDGHPLRSLFSRPQKGKSFSSYNNSLTYEPDDQNVQVFSFPETTTSVNYDIQSLYSTVFKNLYEQVRSVVIFAKDSIQLEDFVFSLWGQQWPALRSRFTFSTGSLAARTIQRSSFALQIAPYQNISIFRHNHSNLALIDTTLGYVEESKTSYIDNYRSFRDLQDPLIRFVWHYGSQIEPLRKNFGWLAKFFSLLNEVRHKRYKLTRITDHLAAKFPSPKQMMDLKAALYGGSTNDEIYVKPLSNEATLLRELFRTQHEDIFEVETLNIFHRATKLVERSPKAAIKIAKTFNKEMGINAIRRDFFRGIANQLSPNVAFDLSQGNDELLLLLFSFNPKLAATPEVWRMDNKIREEVIKLLISVKEDDYTKPENLDWRPLIYSMLDANVDSFPQQVEEILGGQLSKFILDWHEESVQRTFREGWIRYLKSYPQEVMEWAYNSKCSVRTKSLIITIQSPHSSDVLQYGSSPWLEIARNGPEAISSEDVIPVMGFLLTLGFKNIDDGASDLVAASFQTIYDAAFWGLLPERIWSFLDKLAPSNTIIFEWDKCRRLEEALVSKTITYKWPDELLLKAAKSPGAFWNVVKRADGNSSGRKLLRRLFDKVSRNIIPATIEQRYVLMPYGDKK